MKLNENKQINGNRVILVPYEKHHVPRYHEWMKSEELQLLTASEPLTLHEEYDMQQSWRDDPHKCTFIILSKQLFQQTNSDEIASMVGDVNLFCNDADTLSSAEVEIMIADRAARGGGLGKDGLHTMMRYGIENLNITRYTAKIGLDNIPSLNMFNKLGFTEISRSDVFKEVTLDLAVTPEVINSITSATSEYSIDGYPT